MSESPDGVLRWAVVLADAAARAAAPPGVEGRRYALAMCEDVIELVGDLAIVTPAVLCVPGSDDAWTADVAALCWPGTVIGSASPSAGGGAASLAALELAHEHGAHAAAVVA